MSLNLFSVITNVNLEIRHAVQVYVVYLGSKHRDQIKEYRVYMIKWMQSFILDSQNELRVPAEKMKYS